MNQEREIRVASRMAVRANDLQSIPISIPADLRIKAQIEILGIRLVNFQRQVGHGFDIIAHQLMSQVRLEIGRYRPNENAALSTALRRAAFRKSKKDMIRDVSKVYLIDKLGLIIFIRRRKLREWNAISAKQR